MIYPTKTMLTTTCSHTCILSLLFMIPLSSVLNSPVLAQPTMATGSSGLGNSGMNFGPMNLVNNILNSSSLSITLGMSTVKGVKVTGVNLLQNNEVSVVLRQIITSPGNTRLPGSVTVIALRLPMNLGDLMSMASASAASAASSNKTANGSSNNMSMMSSSIRGYGGAAGNPTSSFMNNQLAFLKNIQVGSTNIVNADWRLPQSVTLGLVGLGGGSSSSNKSTSSPSAETADFIMVIVIPFTGKSNLST
jgi:hypothetical protein